MPRTKRSILLLDWSNVPTNSFNPPFVSQIINGSACIITRDLAYFARIAPGRIPRTVVISTTVSARLFPPPGRGKPDVPKAITYYNTWCAAVDEAVGLAGTELWCEKVMFPIHVQGRDVYHWTLVEVDFRASAI